VADVFRTLPNATAGGVSSQLLQGPSVNQRGNLEEAWSVQTSVEAFTLLVDPQCRFSRILACQGRVCWRWPCSGGCECALARIGFGQGPADTAACPPEIDGAFNQPQRIALLQAAIDGRSLHW